MLLVLFSSILIVLFTTGFGRLFCQICKLDKYENPFLYTWIGFFVIATLTLFFSFFFSVNIIMLSSFAVIGLFGLKKWFAEFKISTKFITITIALFIIFSCCVAYILYSHSMYDTDLYHAQIVKWFNEYGTVRGLGNLHARLGFNSLWLTFAALLDNGVWNDRSEWLMPVFWLVSNMLYFFYEICYSTRKEKQVFSVVMLLYLFYLINTFQNKYLLYPQLYYDCPGLIINSIVVLETYSILLARNANKKYLSSLIAIMLLSVCCFMIKPIGAISVIFTGILSLFLLIKDKVGVRVYLKIFCMPFVAIIIWIVRNILVTGYPLYPIPILGLHLDWTMAFADVKLNYDIVLGWARMPTTDCLSSLNNDFIFWFKPWFINSIHINKTTYCVLLVSIIISVFLLCNYRKKVLWWFLIWSVANIVYWFISAPDFRFGDGFFWTWLAITLLFLTDYFNDKNTIKIKVLISMKIKKVLNIAFFISIVFIVAVYITSTRQKPDHSLLSIGTMPSLPVKEYKTNAQHPFIFWVPESGDRTGNSPLPSTTEPKDNIEMRETGNFGAGFRYVEQKN
jgi:hypothetical protein